MGLLRRVGTILLLPIIIFVFMVGWFFHWAGKQQNKGNLETLQVRSNAAKEDTDEEFVEVGLIEELMEKQLEVKG